MQKNKHLFQGLFGKLCDSWASGYDKKKKKIKAIIETCPFELDDPFSVIKTKQWVSVMSQINRN